MNPSITELLATVFFGLAVLHTFCVKRFAHWAHRFPPGSVLENLLHFLAETEIVFGLWAAALFLGIAAINGSFAGAVPYIESLNFTEPKFVFVIMVVAATRPVVRLAETLISLAARLIPARESVSFYIAALSLGPLLGSFITEPAAMTLLALLLKRRYFDRGIGRKLAYATLGLLFVNVSIGGTLTHFAAPPVLMVAAKWNWGFAFMFEHFGWRAAAACGVSTAIVAAIYRRELNRLEVERDRDGQIPVWLTGLTAITDNAALTYLGSMVDGISEELRYALVAGAVAGGGLTVIANAPNPAGVGILQDAEVFKEEGISPLGLFLGALPPTTVAIVFFWLLH
jgi:Na+/H+ antiporter NhaD/arsenite permease-like protein